MADRLRHPSIFSPPPPPPTAPPPSPLTFTYHYHQAGIRWSVDVGMVHRVLRKPADAQPFTVRP